MSQDHDSLFSLFQQKNCIDGARSGFFFKTLNNSLSEIDVPLCVFSEFVEGILYYINECNQKYQEEKQTSMDSDMYFNPLLYSPILLEKMDKFTTPIIVDIDLKFTNEDADVFFHDKFIYLCVKELQELILSIFNVPPSDEDINKFLVCFFLETDPWIDIDGNQCISLRFQFPFARTNLQYLNRLIIPRFKEFLVSGTLLKDYLHKTPLNTHNMVLEKNEYVALYGCKERADKPPYFYKSTYSLITETYDLLNDYDNESILPFYIKYTLTVEEIQFIHNYFLNPTHIRNDVHILEIQRQITPLNHNFISSGMLSLDSIEVDNRMENLPLILSVHFSNEVLTLDQDIANSILLSQQSKNTEKPKMQTVSNSSYDRFQFLEHLMPLIGKHRFTEYYKHDWLTIGKTIHAIYAGHLNGLKIFQHYTTDVELNSQCEEVYEEFSSELFDIRTIRHYASIDNPEKYNEFHEAVYSNYLLDGIKHEEILFAQFVAELFCLDFTYDPVNNIWYYFNGIRLIKDNGNLILSSFITSTEPVSGNNSFNGKNRKLRNTLDNFGIKLSRDALESNDRFSKERCEDIMKCIMKKRVKLTTNSFVNKVIESLKIFMYDEHLANKTDENPMVMACTDCVFECIDKNIITRPGKLQDYITKSTGICFPSTYTINNPKVKFMEKYYGQVHTDPELCHFFKKTLASLLRGGNAEKFFINWIGEANASKSQVLKFVQAALGEYAVILPNHIITLNINSNSGKPEPALERAKGARVGFAAETDRSEKWHVGHIKKFTSGDDYDNRTLNKEGGQRSASFQLIAMSNIDLDAPNADEAYFSRYVKIPFFSKWVDDASESEEEQYRQRRFPIDLDFSLKIKKYAQAQLWLMFHYYPIYMREGIRRLPEIVKIVTMKHQRDIDVLYNFVNDRLLTYYVGDPKDKILDTSKKVSVYDLHSLYKRWYRSAYGHDLTPLDQFKFRDEMCRRIGDINEDACWVGICPRQIEVSASL